MWPNNGELYERLRAGLLERAGKAEAAGDVDLADELRVRAAMNRKERDRCYRDHERRVLNRRIRQGRF